MSLTDTQCKAAQPKGKIYKLSDSDGLYLEVVPKGGKYWRLKYRLHGKEKRISIDVYPRVLCLQRGRKRNLLEIS
ncbi:Arm DNA-binding domain-containing protein [Dyadobacter sp. CY327]|uniref:Arm DNA-binding domain-containing protein n=1 Tax=Dyadobacter sp. CY327 TaxID=2907301 RepID=UPI0038D4831A